MKNQIRIIQINDRFVVDTQDGRTHILNRISLKWNLKHVFGLTGENASRVLKMVNDNAQGVGLDLQGAA